MRRILVVGAAVLWIFSEASAVDASKGFFKEVEEVLEDAEIREGIQERISKIVDRWR